MENVPKLVRERLKTAPPTSHPDADLLAAFAEQSLKGYERAQILEHLAACADCREVVSLALPPQEVATPAIKKTTWPSFPMLRWVTAAALVVIVAGAVLLREPHKFAAPSAIAKIQSGSASPALSQSDEALSRADKDQAFHDRLENGVVVKKELKSSPETRNEIAVLSKSNVPGKKPLVNESRPGPAGPRPPSSGKAIRGQESQVATAAPALVAPVPERSDAATSQQVPEVPSTSQSVEVTAAAPMITTRGAEVNKAKKPLSKVSEENVSAAAGGIVALEKNATADAALGAASRSYAQLIELPLSRWTISANGSLERSLDSGKTWEKVTVEPGLSFRAVSAVGSEVWAGGSAGLLYHSFDAGQHWTRIRPSADGTGLTDDIARIEFIDHQHGKLTTTGGKDWSTSDAGETWTAH